jgi:hypothetical protein
MDRSPKLLLIVLFIASAFVVAACGDDSSSSAPSSKARGGGDAGELDAKLDIRMDHVSEKGQPNVPVPTRLSCTKSSPASCTGSLECPGSDPADDAACAWVAEHRDELTKRDGTEPPGRACTMQYGGPATVRITGTIDGKQVKATFSRQNGCAIGDWESASILWA